MAFLEAGDQFPHVELTAVGRAAVPYRQLWQRRALLLVMAPAAAAAGYAAKLAAAEPPSAAGLPGPDELIEWLRYVQMQCPECQGEAR